MTSSAHACQSCATPIPGGSLYCPSCGAATPTEISQETGTAHRPAAELLDEAEQRERVQRALGEHFELGRLLGRGGFAEVYAATDRKLQRTVAVKVLRPDLVVNRSLTERFLREARAAAKLRHPNIIPIYQVGEAEGLAYFLMPLIEGESLREYMERAGPLPIDESRRILRETAEALAVAHEAGLVHRDIKPDNIMLEGQKRRAIVTDFGIAKALGSSEIGLTGTGMIVGTPHYMSPEQASGSKRVESRSDVYSLGVVGYQMLTGRLPFEGETTHEVLVKHLTAPPRPVRDLRPDVPDDLGDAIDRCLAKQPERRWATADELAERLVSSESHVPLSGQRAGGGRAPRISERRFRLRRWHVLVVALVGLILSLSTVARPIAHSVYEFWVLPTESTPGSRAPWADLGWRAAYLNAQLGAIGDSLLVVYGPGLRPRVFDGTDWRSVPILDSATRSDTGFDVPPLKLGDSLWMISHNPDGMYAWTAQGLSFRESLSFSVSAVWSDGREAVLGTAEPVNPRETRRV